MLNIDELAKNSLTQRNVRDFFKYARAQYLASKGLARQPKQDLELQATLAWASREIGCEPETAWGTPDFQILLRATTPEHLELLGIAPELSSEAAVESGRVMSLLPFNAVMDDTTIRKYVPSRPDRYSGNWRHSLDPYGIFSRQERIVARTKDGAEIYLATRKFSYAVLANITEACYIGCDGCYKGAMVRTALWALSRVSEDYAQIKRQLTLEENRAERQAELLAEWLDSNPDVDTVVISGGEPMLFSNGALKRILAKFGNAKHVKVVRVCTAAIFQGMWYRVDDGFADALAELRDSTGKQVYINAHLTDEHQLAAPEAKIAVDTLRRRGITVHLQMPLQQGINFDRNDLKWSVKKLAAIAKQAYYLGVIPYKLIIDMHSPSHPDLTVPLETVMKAIAFLDLHERHSDQERWQAVNILHQQGNLYLPAYPHFAAAKEVNAKSQTVTYFIPKVNFSEDKHISIHTYREPLITGHNDDPASIPLPIDKAVLDKIRQARAALSSLSNAEEQIKASAMPVEQKAEKALQAEREFWKACGLEYPENKPLALDSSP